MGWSYHSIGKEKKDYMFESLFFGYNMLGLQKAPVGEGEYYAKT